MTNREKIAELQAQRADLNRRIQALKNEGELVAGPVRIARVQESYTNHQERWALAYKVPMRNHISYRGHAEQYKTIFVGDTQKDCIEAIPRIISELTEMLKYAEGESAQ